MIEHDPAKIRTQLDAEFPISAHLTPEELCNCPDCLKRHQNRTRYAVRQSTTREWWMGGSGWSVECMYAQLFTSAAEASSAALRELHDTSSAWHVVAL